MNVPQLRFSGFDGEWELKRIKDIAPLQRGFDLVKENIVPGKYPIGYSNGILGFHNEYKAKGPGVFTGRSGTIGNIHFTESDYWPHNTSLWVTDFKGNKEKFIYYFYKKVDLKKYNAGSTVPTLNRNDVHDLKRAIPKREEQEKIADFLTLLEKRIEKQQEKIEKLEHFKKGMMQKIFSQELRFKDEDGGEFPEWEEELLSQISIINPKTEPLQDEFYYIDLESVDKGRVGELKVVNMEDAPSRAQRVLMKNDVLFQTVRPYQQNHFYVEELSDKQLVASTGFAQIRTNQSSRYIYYLMHTEEFSQEVLNRCTGTSYPAINSSHLGKIKVPVPSLAEQIKIADFLFALDNKLTKEKEKLMVLEEQKRGFMWGMFV